MAGNRRGFTKERHAGTKVAAAVVAVTGFAAAWAGFAGTHDSAPAVPTSEPTQAATATVTAAPGTTPAPTAAPTRARRSRGS